MSYKKKINLVETEHQFRDYLISKNPRTKRMLESYEENIEGIGFFCDSDFALFGKRNKPNSKKLSWPYLISSKKPGDRGRVFIDTGYLEITESGEVTPSKFWFTSKGDISQYFKEGVNGLKFIKTELNQVIDLYEKIFERRQKNQSK